MADNLQVNQVVAQVLYQVIDTHTETGGATIALTPDGDTVATIVVSGAATISISPTTDVISSTYSVTATGGLEVGGSSSTVAFSVAVIYELTATGGIEISSDTSYEWSYASYFEVEASEGIELGGSSSSVEFTIPASYDPSEDFFYATGGFELGGSETETGFEAKTANIVALGGFGLGDSNVIDFPEIPVYEIESTRGLKLSGSASIVFSRDIKKYSVTATGGFFISDSNTLAVTTPDSYTIVSSRGGFCLTGKSSYEFTDPPILEVTAYRGLRLNGNSEYELTYPDKIFEVLASGGFDLYDDNTVQFVHPAILSVISQGGFYLGAESSLYLIDEIYNTWSLMGDGFDTSLYSGWNFNSYANFFSQLYAAGEDGIYLIGGEFDDGEIIHPGIRIGPTNFGTEKPKFVRSVRTNDPNATVRIANSDEDGNYQAENGRAVGGRDIIGEELTIDITEFKKISHVEIVPLIKSRR